MLAPDELHVRYGNPLLARYLRDLVKIRAWWVLILHYLVILMLGLGFMPVAVSGSIQHPEILIKVIGAYCLLIGTLVIPLVSPILFPPIGETDPAFDSAPVSPLQVFDARMFATIILSALAVLPLLPISLAFDPLTGTAIDPYDIFPFLQAVAAAAWVNLIMEMAESTQDRIGRPARRIGVICAFVLLHVCLVGLMAQLSYQTLYRFNPLKILIDINPFSQFFILMEGTGQRRLLLATDALALIDYRLYLFVLQFIVLTVTWAVYRAILRSRSGIT